MRPYISIPAISFSNQTLRGVGPQSALKEVMMTPKFLREEAARFRGMAGTADLEASKVRFLAMATDFESRATAADELIEPKLAEVTQVKTSKRIAKEPSEPV
jgi:hypothetical protein